ncbi:tetratricopeptide repeat protein, partial [Rothia aeria]|uniref:tetratricopeptide repeat protein n=1 Tax=Rothia aeria TaxID=172042 RepID=UPI00058783C2
MTEPNKPLDQMTAQERLDLGMSHFEEGRFDEAIKALSSVHREETDSITYAWAQLGLGFAYNRSGKLDEAIEALSNISHGDTPGVYAWAQLGLG